ncbi:MAG: hypothetical protein ACKN97_04095, partial [Acidobacteriota bacterium]
MFADLAEMNVSALAAAPQGGLFAATSPDGKVYRIDREGKASIYFEPKEKYIWALAVMKSGELVVATGDAGRIYKVKENSGKVEAKIFYDSSETHIISLATNPSGELFAGTDSGGLVLKFSPEGRPFTLLDSPLREIHSLKVDEEGNVYALAVAESVSAKTEKAETPDEPKSVTAKRTSGIQSEQANKSRYDFSQSKSAVYRIGPDGSTSVIWNSPSVAAFAIEPLGGLGYTLVGTSDRGRVFVVDKDGMRESMVGQLSESQVSGIVTAGDDVVMTTSGQGKVFAMDTDAPTGTGTYQSPILDAKAVSSWGRLTSRSSGDVAFETRSGNSEVPDGTWSGWTAAGGSSSPKGRYFQWRVTMKGSATVSDVSLAFVQDNIAPEILSLNILPTNVGLAPNATVAVDPNIELSGQDGSDFGLPTGIPTPRKLFQRGARSLQWTAEDRNGDKLTYAVRYRRADEGGGFVTVRSGIVENYLTIDGLSLSDGRYIFEVVASDASSNPAGRGLEGSMRSEPIDIDSAAPIVERVGAVRF